MSVLISPIVAKPLEGITSVTLLTGPAPTPAKKRKPAAAPTEQLVSSLGRWWATRESFSAGERLAYGLIALAVLVPVMFSQLGIYTPDIKIEVYLNPWHRFALDLSTWLPDPQGGTGNYNLGLAPVDFTIGILHTLGFSPELSMRVSKAALILFGAWGAVKFLREVSADKATPVTRVALALAFVTNPYAIVGASQLAIQLPYSLLPWFLLAIVRAVRCGGWRWPGLSAVLFFAMSGMNTGVIPIVQCAVVPALVIWVARRWQIGRRACWLAIGRIALLLGLISLYWLIPAISAFGTASTIVANTETIETISNVSSFSEVLRGLGMWTTYGQSAITGPWQPGFMSYLANPFVIIASFLFPIMALVGLALSRSTVRVLALAMTLSAAILMVGQFPPNSPSVFGRLLNFVFTNVPGAIAFRTTNKAGAGMALGMSILVALAVGALAPRWRTLGERFLAGGVALLVVALSAFPAVAGQLYTGRWAIPEYWSTVGQKLESGSAENRVWWLPGQVLARYRWSTDSYDDLPFSILDKRHSMLRTTLPTESPHLTNFLAASDTQLQNGSLNPSSLSSAGWYLGVGNLFLRNDFNWEAFGGGRPSVVQPQIDRDPGVTQTNTLGRPGENVVSPNEIANNPLTKYDADTPPLHIYAMKEPGSIVRAEPASRTAVIDGDAFAFNDVAQSGLLTAHRPFRYAGDLNASSLPEQLGPGHELIITDSNRRRNFDDHRLLGAWGPLLSAGDQLGTNRVLYPDDANKQSVLAWLGAKSVTTHGFSAPNLAFGSPRFAFDASLPSYWQIGDGSGSIIGSGVDITLEAPTAIGKITIASRVDLPSVDKFTVTVGETEKTATVAGDGQASVDFRGTTSDHVRIDVASTPNGPKSVAAINNISIGGTGIVPVLQTPSALSQMVQKLGPDQQQALNTTPISVSLSRDFQGQFGDDDQEPTLERVIAYPADRTLSAFGVARGIPTQKLKNGCYGISTLNGTPVSVKPWVGKPTSAPWLFTGCEGISMVAGSNVLISSPGVVVDTMTFRDPISSKAPPPSFPPASRVTSSSNTTTVASFDPSLEPQYAVFSQNWTTGWKATVDGVETTPVIIDGHAVAVALSPGAGHTVSLNYSPQTIAPMVRWVSIAALAMALVLWLCPGRLRRSRKVVGSPLAAMPSEPPPSRNRVAVRLREPWVLAATISIASLLLGGFVIGAVTAVAAAVAVVLEVRPTRLFAASVVAMACAPLLWIAGNVSQWNVPSPALVLGNQAPSVVVASSLAVSVFALLLQIRRRP